MITFINRNSILLALSCALVGCQKEPSKSAAHNAAVSAPPTKSASTAVSIPHEVPKSYDGPFGLAGGMPIAELTQLGFKPVGSHPGIFTGTAPKPIDEVTEYIALATPDAGVCRINARVNIPVVNGSGDQVKSKVDQLAEIMAVKYGKHSGKEDYISQEVYRRNPQYWMMGLQEDSVFYVYSWQSGKTQQQLPNGLQAIEVAANASSLDKAWASIQYTFTNFDACLQENQKRKASNL